MASKRSRKQETAETISKKIKLKQKLISESISKNYPDNDITNHEVNKFILIFNLLLETLNKGRLLEVKAQDSEDGPIENTIILVVTKLISVLKGNVESLKLPKIIKIRLKKLKIYLFLTMARTKMIARMVSEKRKNLQQRLAAQAAGKPRPARVAPSHRRAINGVKNIEERIRNRTFKIKKLIAHLKNIEVKKNGPVVGKMTVQRRAIFPGEQRPVYY